MNLYCLKTDNPSLSDMNLSPLKSLRSVAHGLVCAMALAATTGCMSMAQAGLDYSTTKIIDGSAASVPLDGQAVELAAHLEARTKPPGSGVLVVQLKAAASWPKDWRPAQFSFRPQGAAQSFNLVEIDTNGSLLRALGKDGLQPETEAAADRRIIRLQLTAVASQPYELLVSLRHADGRRANLALRSITVR